MFKRILKHLIKLYYKANPDLLAWTIPVDDVVDLHLIVEKSYIDRHEYGTSVEYYHKRGVDMRKE